MNKIALILLPGLLLLPGPSRGETPRPKEPLVPRLPSPSAWRIECSYAEKAAPAKPVPMPAYVSFQRPVRVSVEKSAKALHEETVWDSGQKSEIWIYGNLRLGTRPGSGQVIAMPYSEDEGEEEGTDYRKGDFEGLQWLSLAHFQGVEDFHGTPVYRFAAPASSGHGERIALLSVKEQRPLWSREGDVERRYTYLSPPPPGLTPPAPYRELFEGWKKSAEALRRPPSPP